MCVCACMYVGRGLCIHVGMCYAGTLCCLDVCFCAVRNSMLFPVHALRPRLSCASVLFKAVMMLMTIKRTVTCLTKNLLIYES